MLTATFYHAYAKMLAKTPPSDQFSIKIVCLEKVPIVEVQLNGVPAYFILDSGSDISLLNQTDADKYQFTLAKSSSKDLRGFSGGVQVLHHAAGISLKLNDHEIKVSFYTAHLDQLVQVLKQYSSIKITGIIGLDVMKEYGFEIDYSDQLLHFNL